MGLYFGLTREEAELAFWSRLTPNLLTGCWEWRLRGRTDGYGTMRSPFWKEKLAHRVAYSLENGPIPAGLHVRHKCDNPACAFPNHLELGTPLENSQDSERRGRRVHPKGADHYQKQFTPDQVRQIRALYAPYVGRPGRHIALENIGKTFNVSDNTIRDIVFGRSFKWVL